MIEKSPFGEVSSSIEVRFSDIELFAVVIDIERCAVGIADCENLDPFPILRQTNFPVSGDVAAISCLALGWIEDLSRLKDVCVFD